MQKNVQQKLRILQLNQNILKTEKIPDNEAATCKTLVKLILESTADTTLDVKSKYFMSKKATVCSAANYIQVISNNY